MHDKKAPDIDYFSINYYFAHYYGICESCESICAPNKILSSIQTELSYFDHQSTGQHRYWRMYYITSHFHQQNYLATHTHTHTRLKGPFPDQSGFYWSKRQWVAVASAGPYASLTLLQTDNHASTPPLSFLQARCPSCCPTNSVKALKASVTHLTPVYILNWLVIQTNSQSNCPHTNLSVKVLVSHQRSRKEQWQVPDVAKNIDDPINNKSPSCRS